MAVGVSSRPYPVASQTLCLKQSTLLQQQLVVVQFMVAATLLALLSAMLWQAWDSVWTTMACMGHEHTRTLPIRPSVGACKKAYAKAEVICVQD